jgi:tetratricopeptide (TPR) repeat protein
VKFLALLCFVVLFPVLGMAISTGAQQQAAAPAQAAGHLILVLPFENHSAQPSSLDWIGESMPAVMNRRLESAGFLPIGREDRLYALDHLGLPPNFRPTRASTIRLAQNLDADSVVIGSYASDGKRILLTARILDIAGLKLSAPIEQQGDLARLLDGINDLAWQVVRHIDPTYPVAEQTFVAADAALPLSAFENYIRGLVEDTPAERIKHLKEAVQLDPGYYTAWFALGRAYFLGQEYEQASVAFGKIPKTEPSVLSASFDRGLASFYTGNYVQAEESFAFVATQLPLSEVINNQAVAASRQNHDAVALFQQAVNADPKDPDYRFNLALALRRRKDLPGAMREVGECLKLRPQDAEAQTLLASLEAAGSTLVSPPAAKANTLLPTGPANAEATGPLERIKRNYNEASFRQAAYAIDQMQAMKLESLPPPSRSAAYASAGTRYLKSGLLLEAERQFQDALVANPSNAAAHAGLAQIRERSGDADGARLQANLSLQDAPNADAHMVLARLDLQAGQLSSSAGEVSQALKIDPKSPAALELRLALQSKGQQVQ